MSRIPKNTRLKNITHQQQKIKFKKPNPIVEKTLKTPSKLERTPAKEYMDYSTEDYGYFTRRDAKGNVLEVFTLIFPR